MPQAHAGIPGEVEPAALRPRARQLALSQPIHPGRRRGDAVPAPKARPSPVKSIATAVLFFALAACSLFENAPGGDDTSKEHKPPPSWQAGIQFRFADSVWSGHPPVGNPLYGAEVRFHDGRRERIVSGRGLFFSGTSVIQTPWYRIWFPRDARELNPTLRVTIGDREGHQSVAEYPIRVLHGDFHVVLLAVYTPEVVEGRWVSPARSTTRAYDVPAAAKELPTDSLHIGYFPVPSPCFNCP